MAQKTFNMPECFFYTFQRLKDRSPKEACEYIEAIFNYAYYGILPEEGDPVWLYGLPVVFDIIDHPSLLNLR